MNLEDMIKNMNPQMLSNALAKMSTVLSPEQLRQVENVIKTTDKGTLNSRLNSLDSASLQKELKSNPQLAKSLSQNPELMKKINEIFKK